MDKIDNLKIPSEENPIPLYIQIENTLRKAITNGIYKPGDMIPAESDLCEYFKISRTVVRQALRSLQYESLIIRKKGKGTFVLESKIPESFGQELVGFYETMVAKGYGVSTKILEKKKIVPDQNFQKIFSLEPGDYLIKIKRLRYHEDNPLLVVTSYLPHDCCHILMELDLENVSLYKTLEDNLGMEIHHGTRSIESCLASSEISKLLDVPIGAPLLNIKSTTYLKNGSIVEFYNAFYRGDLFKFEVKLVRSTQKANGGSPDIKTINRLPYSEGTLK